MGINTWVFSGNLARDAEQKFTQSGDSIVTFSVGVKSGFGDKAKTSWPRCSIWGKRGESVMQFLSKGQLVGISGEVTMNEFTNKEGNKQQSLEVRVNDLTLLGKKDSQPAPRQEKPQGTAPDDFDDDVPF